MLFVETNGAKIPAIGLGTWELSGRTCARLVEQALKLGYRHIDTAQVYENEREVGDGVRASGIRRDDVFVTTKVWTTHFAPNDLERSTKESLVRLRWLVQLKVGASPGTTKLERLSETIDIFDFELSDTEIDQVSRMGSAKTRLTDFGFAPKWD